MPRPATPPERRLAAARRLAASVSLSLLVQLPASAAARRLAASVALSLFVQLPASAAALRLAASVALSLTIQLPASAAPPAPRPTSEHVPTDIFSLDRGLPNLESLGDGRLRHRGAGFTATIHPDGSVKFKDVVDRDYKLIGFDFRKRRLDAPLDRRPPAMVDFEERAIFPLGRLPIAGVGGRFGGLADWTLGQKHVGAKRAFLAATAGLRYRLSYAWQRARTQEQLAALGDRLVALWRDPKLPLAERKRRVFVLWDECDELDPSPASPFDALRGVAGDNARRKIAAFVRMVAAPGTPDVFTADDLARLNAARRSAARFDPYRDDGAPLPDLPELPAEAAPDPARADPDPDPEPTYGPIPEPAVALPAPKPEPVKPPPQRKPADPYNRVKIGPLNIPIGRR
jgi:hypothetical protein